VTKPLVVVDKNKCGRRLLENATGSQNFKKKCQTLEVAATRPEGEGRPACLCVREGRPQISHFPSSSSSSAAPAATGGKGQKTLREREPDAVAALSPPLSLFSSSSERAALSAAMASSSAFGCCVGNVALLNAQARRRGGGNELLARAMVPAPPLARRVERRRLRACGWLAALLLPSPCSWHLAVDGRRAGRRRSETGLARVVQFPLPQSEEDSR